MATQKQSNQRIHEVQQVLASYVPKLPGTDVNLLAALCKAVLTSVDIRDIRRISSEQLGVNFAMATPGPLGFGIVATLMTRKTSTGGAGKPLGLGCLAGFLFATAVSVFFTAIWPSL